VIGAKEEK